MPRPYRSEAIAIILEEMKRYEDDRSAALEAIHTRIKEDRELYEHLVSPSLQSIITTLMREADATVRAALRGAPITIPKAAGPTGRELVSRALIDVVYYNRRLGDWTVRELRNELSGIKKRLATEAAQVRYLEQVCNQAAEQGSIDVPIYQLLTAGHLAQIPPPTVGAYASQ